MRKTIVFGALAALLGLAAVAQANDQPRAGARDDSHITRAAAKHERDGKHEREARNEDKRAYEAAEERGHRAEAHDENEAAEHGNRH